MPSWVKVILVLFGIFVVVISLGITGFFYWLDANKDEFKEIGRRVSQEASEFAKGKTNEQCVDEAFFRFDKDASLMSNVELELFLNFCLQKSIPSMGFCDNVPKENEIVRNVAWVFSFCSERNLVNDQSCMRLAGEIPTFCSSD